MFFALAQMVVLYSCTGSGSQPDASATATAATPGASAAAAPALPSGDAMVLIETDLGNMKVRLYDSTPEHKKNFLKLAKEGFYDGTLFHRVIPGFMVQGGDPDSKKAAAGQPLGMGGPGYTIPAEIGAKHFRGALSAARQGDQVNPEKRSSGSQFYIVQNGPVPTEQLAQVATQKGLTYTPEEQGYYQQSGGTPFLDGDYTVFGMVVEGLDVIDKIASAHRDGNDRPVQDIHMKVKIISE